MYAQTSKHFVIIRLSLFVSYKIVFSFLPKWDKMQRTDKEIIPSTFTRLNWKHEFIIYKSLQKKAKREYDHQRFGVDKYQMFTNP